MMASATQGLVPSLLQWGDDALVLGQRTSAWCGHGPILEEDIALANISLDLIGQARNWLTLAGDRMAEKKSEDDLAYFRTERQFRNHQMLELPNGDFGMTIGRLCLWSQFSLLRLTELADQTADPDVSAVAAKAIKEAKYHFQHSRDWVVRLGDGTEESHQRMQKSLEDLWPYAGEWFEDAEADAPALSLGVMGSPARWATEWEREIAAVLEAAGLKMPNGDRHHRGGKDGLHTEHLGYLLAEMQSLARTHPGATW